MLSTTKSQQSRPVLHIDRIRNINERASHANTIAEDWRRASRYQSTPRTSGVGQPFYAIGITQDHPGLQTRMTLAVVLRVIGPSCYQVSCCGIYPTVKISVSKTDPSVMLTLLGQHCISPTECGT